MGGTASVLVARGAGMGDLQPIASHSAEILSAAWAIHELFFAKRRDVGGAGPAVEVGMADSRGDDPAVTP